MRNLLPVIAILFLIFAILAGVASCAAVFMLLIFGANAWVAWLMLKAATACLGFTALSFLFSGKWKTRR